MQWQGGLGYKTSYKHYYEDENIAIVPDLSKENDFWQVYYKPLSVKELINWFNENKEKIEYTIIYQKILKMKLKDKLKKKASK